MAQEGISAALRIDDKILEGLKVAQDRITSMRSEADKLAKSFSTIGNEIGKLASGIKGTNVSLDAMFNTNGTLQNLKLVIDAVNSVGKRTDSVTRNVSVVTKSMNGEFKEYIQNMTRTNDGLKKMASYYKELEKVSASSARQVALTARERERSLYAFNNTLDATGKNAKLVGTLLSQAFTPLLIQRFIQNMVSVRGEFEMAERSLAVIIKDATRAQSMFNEITRIAIRSPFSVSDILKQTKQLAAYRIETDKLIDTTKMLGDISAGVGVDMNRLILAYGQVKSAEFLKGTELRQFSEAGVNMLGGLAERFTEIYGRVVSVGEVMQMVSKRMVKFADVEAVLRSVTEAGGTFYKMQEQQASTLRGRIVNLGDRIQLAFNEMGQSYDGFIKKIVSGLEVIISHWQVISTTMIPLLSGKLFSGIASLLVASFGRTSTVMKNIADSMERQRKLAYLTTGNVTAMGRAWANIKGVISGLGLVGVVQLTVTLVSLFSQLWKNAHRLEKEVSKIVDEAKKSSDEQVSRYNQLLNIVTNINAKERDRQRALDNLKTEFGGLLDLQNIELANATELNKRRSQQIEIIRMQAREEAKLKAINSAIDDERGGSDRRVKGLKESIGSFYGRGNLALKNAVALITDDELAAIEERATRAILEGSMSGVQDAGEYIVSEILALNGSTQEEIKRGIDSVDKYYINSIGYLFSSVQRRADIISKDFGKSMVELGAPRAVRPIKEAIRALSNLRSKFNFDDPRYGDNPMAAEFAFRDEIQDAASAIIRDIDDIFGRGDISEELADQLRKEVGNAFRSEADLGNNVDEYIKRLQHNIYEEFKGISLPKLEEGATMKDYAKEVKKALDEMQSDLSDWNWGGVGEGRVKELENQYGTKEGLISYVNGLTKLYGSLGAEAPKATSSITAETKALKQELADVNKEVKDLWDQYDNSKKLEEWGFVPSGGSSSDIMKKISDIESDLREKGGQEAIDLANSIAEKRVQLARTEQEEIAKLMYEANKKALDKVQQAYQTMFENVEKFKRSGLSQTEIDTATANQIAKSMKEVADAQWDAYKGSQEYALAFGDLKGLGDEALGSLKRTLEYWRDAHSDALSPTEMRSIERALKNIRREMQDKPVRSFFGAMKDGFDHLTNARKEAEQFGKLEAAFASAQKRVADAQSGRDLAAGAVRVDASVENIERLQMAEANLKKAQEARDKAQGDLISAQEDYNTELDLSTSKLTALEQLYNRLSSAITSSIGLATDTIEGLGGEIGEVSSAAIDGLKTGLSLVGNAISLGKGMVETCKLIQDAAVKAGVAQSAAFGPLLVVVLAIGAAIMVLKARDASLKKEVDEHKRAVDRLEKAYDKLEKTMNKALGVDSARHAYADMSANLEKQRQELEEAIAANERRKQTSSVRDETEDLRDQLDSVKEKIAETRNAWIEMLGGVSDYQSLSMDWASGWLDAFKKTGDGLSSLNDDFEEFYDNLVVGQLWSRIMEPYINDIKALSDDILEDGLISPEEAAAVRAVKANLAEASRQMTDMARTLGVSSSFGGDTVQRGVQTVTEQTATALESILNSTRYDVSSTNVHVANIELALTSEGDNTILANLRSQTRYLADIARIASAVYYPGGHPKGSGALKVITEMA